MLAVERADAASVTVDDRAILHWEPRLLQHLMQGDPPPAAGTHPMSGLPLGVMTEAALVAAGRESTGIEILLYANVSYKVPVPRDSLWEVTARIGAIGRRHVVVHAALSGSGGRPQYADAVLGVARVVAGRATADLLSGRRLS